MLIVLSVMQIGCVNSPWTIVSLVGGTLSFGSGLLVGYMANTPNAGETLTLHECFLNDQPIDCSTVPK